MSARCIDIADAVVTALNTTHGLFPPGTVAARRLFVEWDHDRNDMQVVVIPGARDISEGTRSALSDEHTVQVGFRQRVADDAATEAALDMVDRAIAAIAECKAGDAIFIGLANDVPYDHQALREQRLFTTLLQARFRSLA